MCDTAACSAISIAGCVPAPSRTPQVFREVTKVPGAPGKVTEVIKRLPTPAADVIDRTIIELPGQDVINVVYERPSSPPPNVVEKRLVEPPPPTQVNCFERRVPHRPRETVIAATASSPAVVAPAPTVLASTPAIKPSTGAYSCACAALAATAAPAIHVSTRTTTHVPVEAPVVAAPAPATAPVAVTIASAAVATVTSTLRLISSHLMAAPLVRQYFL